MGLAGCSDSPGPPAQSVVRVEAIPCVGTVNQIATAVLVEPDTLLTVAHTFEGIEKIQIRSSEGATTTAEIRYFDNAKDIALLRIEPDWLDSSAPPPLFASPVLNEQVTVASFASADGPQNKTGQVTRLVAATLDGEGKRAAMKLDADIKAGDSGAPVVNDNGQIVGMVFATERGTERGWAIAAKELTTALDKSEGIPTENPLGCS